jgi:ABC-2 type transport system ATP-binding protein
MHKICCSSPNPDAEFPSSKPDRAAAVVPLDPIIHSFNQTAMRPIITVSDLSKTYASGLKALKDINLEIRQGEIFALLGPNGAGKTTLISAICGLVNPTGGTVTVDGHDIITDYRAARSLIGLVPQELTTDAFEKVRATVGFSRGLFGKSRDDAHVETILTQLSLWEKRDNKIMELSGGMKRRVMIAKALAHEPRILFLDEPSAGVDVELRRDMWEVVRGLRSSGVTIILTTHYIEEAQEMADRVGIINRGEIILVEEKRELMRQLGKKQLILDLQKQLRTLPTELGNYRLEVADEGRQLIYTYDTQAERTGITALLQSLNEAGIRFKDLNTTQSSLEQIFVDLVKNSP